MPKRRAPYPPEFRQRIIELVRKGRTPEALPEQFEPSAQTIRNWLAQADRDAGHRPDGLPTDEREELRRLRRKNKTLREEREILGATILLGAVLTFSAWCAVAATDADSAKASTMRAT